MGRRAEEHVVLDQASLLVAPRAHDVEQGVGLEPETLSHLQVLRFCDGHLEAFVAEQGLRISRRGYRKLLRALTRDEPAPPPVPDESLPSKLD